MKSFLLFILLWTYSGTLLGQGKKMTPEVYELWNKIEEPQISDAGNWSSYAVTNEKGASVLNIHNNRTGEDFLFDRSRSAKIDVAENFVAFTISADVDTVKAMKRRKVKKSKMPKDTLCIFNLKTKQVERIPNVSSFKTSNDFPGGIAFKLAKRTQKQDSTLVKDEGKENGSKLVVKNTITGKSKVIPYTKEYHWSDGQGLLVLHNTGEDTLRKDKVLMYDANKNRVSSIINDNGDYKYFVFDKSEENLAFLANRDTSDQKENAHELMHYKIGSENAHSVASQINQTLKSNWQVSEHTKPFFLERSNKLVFGTAPILEQKDTTLLDEEIVNVEVWHSEDGLLHTQQENNLKKELKRSYKAIYDLKTKQMRQLADLDCPELHFDKRTKTDKVLGYNSEKYLKRITWEGRAYQDVYLVDIKSGEKKLLATKVENKPRLSPSGEYALWYSMADTCWYSQNVKSSKVIKMTSGSFYDELNDRPMDPWPSGTVAWSDNNESILYDHYDIWKADVSGKTAPVRLTKGRESRMRYRYINLEEESTRVLPSDTTILLKQFSLDNMTSGYAMLNMGTGVMRVLESGPFEYDRRIIKAKSSDALLFTKESFDLFPDLILSDLTFKKQNKISSANPQQKEYDWGSTELFNWQTNEGVPRKALLAKPANFNPNKKYPLIVNFYEKSSNRLYYHKAPYAHRSTINYTYYTNKGYVVFNPDIYYEDGYPGESCYDAIMASVDQLLEEGFIDEDNMGLQGHSWGGYQIAYLLTKTDRFKCAESGAPVVNMISAYGGIRWGSGMSRMFQYEKTQSRLGATLWERPDLYIYNSPIFNLDKVETPVLILHNDNDGAVPWYQGIEYFVGLRRLGKPAWMLNYNDEPHWPVKKQNRIDFNKRMEQFFDFYLRDGTLPVWMKDGIPINRQGVIDGFESSDVK